MGNLNEWQTPGFGLVLAAIRGVNQQLEDIALALSSLFLSLFLFLSLSLTEFCLSNIFLEIFFKASDLGMGHVGNGNRISSWVKSCT